MALPDASGDLSAAKRALLAQRLRGTAAPPPSPERVAPRPPEAPVPATPGQERLWYLHALAPASAAYTMAQAWRLRGPLDLPRLERSLAHVVAQHEALRTTFALVDGALLQRIAPPPSDLRAAGLFATAAPPTSARADADDAASAFAAAVAQEPFDLEKGPLLRVRLCPLASDDHVLALALHHSIADEASLRLLWQAWTEAYRSDTPLQGGRPGVQYGDYAYAIRHGPSASWTEADLDYWVGVLEGTLATGVLPDFVGDGAADATGGFRSQTLPPSLRRDLLALAAAEQTTLFTVTLTAFALLLHRYTGDEAVVVGAPVSIRGTPDVQSTLGFFLNTLALRVDVDPAGTFRALVRHTRQRVLEGLARRTVPYDRVVERLAGAQGRAPFRTMFVLDQPPAPPAFDPALDASPVPASLGASKFDLSLFVTDSDPLRIAVEFDAARYRPDAVDALLGHAAALLTAAVAEPDRPVGRLPLVGEAEAARVRSCSRAAPISLPDTALLQPDAPVYDAVARMARAAPEQPALVTEAGALSYGDLWAQALSVAGLLDEAGVRPGTFVGLYAERGVEMVVGLLGIQRAGAAYLPLAPEYPTPRLQYMLADAAARVVLTTEALRAQARALAPEADVLTVEAARAAAVHAAGPPRPPARDLDRPAYLIYTSGSTGRPKGVAVTHRNLAFSTSARLHYYGEAPERFLLLSPFSFDSAVAGLFWTLGAGGALVLPRSGEEKDLHRLRALLEAHRVTHTLLLPSLYRLLLDAADAAQLASLRVVIVAGEACPPTLVQRHHAVVPDAAFYNEYGPTEATVWSTVARLSGRADPRARIPIGTPIPGGEAWVLDEHGAPSGLGLPGELYVGGPGVTPGYLGRPDLTTRRFVAHPFSADTTARLYRTGDRARWRPDGQLDFLGRVDDQVKVRGHRIELSEVEAALVAVDAVRDAAAAVLELDGAPQLVAYVVPEERPDDPDDAEAALTPATLRHALRARLPDAFVPSRVVVLDGLPRTPNGKVDRAALPPPSAHDDMRAVEPPANHLEFQMMRLWEDVLGTAPVGATDAFFDLGGHSLLAVALFARIESTFGRPIPLAALSEHPTPRALTRLLHDEAVLRLTSPAPLRKAGDRPPLFCLPGSGGVPLAFEALARYLPEDLPVYGLVPLGVDGYAMPLRRVEAMAAQHIEELRRVQPTGPYRLCGYSMGGLVAYEMAQQLRAAREAVSMLALFDTLNLVAPDTSGSLWERLRRRLHRRASLTRAAFNTGRLRREARAFVERGEVVPRRLREGFPMKEHELGAFAYTPKPYDGTVHFFSASNPEYTEGRHEDGWAPLVRGPFHVHRFESGHHALLHEPIVGDVARVLDDLLRAA